MLFHNRARSPNNELNINGVITNITESEISTTETFLGDIFLPLPLYQPENCNLFRYSTKSNINIANAASHEYFLVVSLTVYMFSISNQPKVPSNSNISIIRINSNVILIFCYYSSFSTNC